MSVGGKVIEVIFQFPRERVYINTEEPTTGEKCAIYVKYCDAAARITRGDTLWWSSANAYWTPVRGPESDFPLERLGYSGVNRPSDTQWPPKIETKA